MRYRMLSVFVTVVVLLTACGNSGSTRPPAQPAEGYSGEVDMEALTARRYRELQQIGVATNYSREADVEALVARHVAALQLLKTAEDAADRGEAIDMEVLTARRYRVQQVAEALRIARPSKP